jgi:hypothetical protein
MMSVSATELAKLGKCEALIALSGHKRTNQTDRSGNRPVRTIVRGNSNSDSSSPILRGIAAHDRFEREAAEHMIDPVDSPVIPFLPRLALAFAVAAGLMTLLAAMTA